MISRRAVLVPLMLWRLAAVELIAAALLCDVVQAGGSQSRQKFTPHRRIADFGISTTIFYLLRGSQEPNSLPQRRHKRRRREQRGRLGVDRLRWRGRWGVVHHGDREADEAAVALAVAIAAPAPAHQRRHPVTPARAAPNAAAAAATATTAATTAPATAATAAWGRAAAATPTTAATAAAAAGAAGAAGAGTAGTAGDAHVPAPRTGGAVRLQHTCTRECVHGEIEAR